MAEGNTYCVNCKRDIPSINFVMHSMHCARNITLCTICEEPVPRSEMDAHQVEFHSLRDCESCGEKLNVSQLKDHKTNSCPMRRVNCSICELELPVAEIGEHENYCGSRTERCEDCGEYVMLKYQKLHLESNHGFLKLDDEPGPTPSWQSGDRVAVNGAFNNDLHSSWKSPNNATFMSARLPNFPLASTSKRTNDMPQVNSVPPPHTSKSVHKAAIMGEMDRPLRNYPVGDHIDSDVAALFSDSLHLAKPLSYSRLSSSAHSSGEEDLVALPCEFCEALVPANQLILHQTACRPDLARYEEPAAASPLNAQSSGMSSILAKHSRINSIAPSYKIHNNLTIPSSSPPQPHVSRRDFSSSEMDDALLPCEFCHESFSVSKLYEHQTQCTQTWPDGLNGRPDLTYSFNGRPNTVETDHLEPLSNCMTGYKASGKNNEKGAYKSIHKEDLKTNAIRHNRLPEETNAYHRTSRDLRRHSNSLEKEWTLPVQQRSNVWPSSSPRSLCQATSDLNEFEEDEGRQALLKQAQMMDQINAQFGLKKESSTSQRNHIYSDLPTWTPRTRKQPNHYTNPPSSSHSLASYPSSSSSSQSGRGGRTTGAIPKQKAGTGKSPITY